MFNKDCNFFSIILWVLNNLIYDIKQILNKVMEGLEGKILEPPHSQEENIEIEGKFCEIHNQDDNIEIINKDETEQNNKEKEKKVESPEKLKHDSKEDSIYILKDIESKPEKSKATKSKSQNTSSNKLEVFVNYINKNYFNSQIIDIILNITAGSHKILRRIYIGSDFDLNIFTQIIFELFEFTDKSWKFLFPTFYISGSPKEETVIYKTSKSTKSYVITLVTLNKLNIKQGDKFLFIHDLYGEKWEINCNILSIFQVKDLLHKSYKNISDKERAIIKLKSLFRPILISGANSSPPEGLGGPSDFLRLLKNKNIKDDLITRKYMKYFRDLREDNEEWMDYVDNLTIDDYLTEFDFEEMQDLLARYNLLTFYDFDYESEKTIEKQVIQGSFLSGSLSMDLKSKKEDYSQFLEELTKDLENIDNKNEK